MKIYDISIYDDMPGASSHKGAAKEGWIRSSALVMIMVQIKLMLNMVHLGWSATIMTIMVQI